MPPRRSSAKSPRGARPSTPTNTRRLAIVHLVQIIGEAANRLSPALTEAHPEIPWRQIVATRNRVVHSYFDIDIDLLWTVAADDIPRLAAQLRAFEK